MNETRRECKGCDGRGFVRRSVYGVKDAIVNCPDCDPAEPYRVQAGHAAAGQGKQGRK